MLFKFTGRKPDNTRVNGHINARDISAAIKALQSKNITISRIKKNHLIIKVFFTIWTFTLSHLWISKYSIRIFCAEMHLCLRSGMPFIDALNGIIPGTKSFALRFRLNLIREKIEKGSSFKEAMLEHSKIFPPLFTSILSQLDTATNFADVFSQIENIYKKKASFLIQLFISTLPQLSMNLLLLGIGTWGAIELEPQIWKIFTEILMITPFRSMVVLHNYRIYFLDNYIAYIVVIISSIAFMLFIKYNQIAKYITQSILLKLPITGPFIIHTVELIFFQTFHNCIKSNISPQKSWVTATNSIDNIPIRKKLETIKELINQGYPFYDSIKKIKPFTSIQNQILMSGFLSENLSEISNISIELAERYTFSFQAIIKEVAKIILSITAILIFLFLVSALALPLYSIFS